MFVKPMAGLLVRDPVTKRQLPADGKEVPETSFWLRRIADGSVIVVLMNGQIPDSSGAE